MELDVDASGLAPPNESVRVLVHPGLCEGWGACARFAAAVYWLDADGYIDIHRMEVPAELAEVALLGASACPAQAITVLATATSTVTIRR